MTELIQKKCRDRTNTTSVNGIFSQVYSCFNREKQQSLPALLALACLCQMTGSWAQTSATAAAMAPVLRAVVSETNPVPYAMFSTEGKLMGGISKSLIDKIAQLNQMPVLYLDVPRARVEGWLISNQADVGCFLSPDWVSKPQELAWVGPLFHSSQLVVRRSDSKPVLQLSDMYHQRVGTIRGFVYPELEQAFAERLMIRDDAHSLESNLTRLAQGRLDAVMAVDLSLGYVMSKRKFEVALSFDPLWTKPPAIYCAISLDSPLRPALLQSFEQLQQSGYIQQLLQQYQPTMPAATAETSAAN